jgi:transcriptional regulator of NAD metabolism
MVYNKYKFIEIQSAQDLTNFVKNLLDQMNDKFKNLSDNIITRYLQNL